MRWLVVSPYLPHPRMGHGGGTAVRQLCEELARHHDTTLLCFQRETESGLDAWLRTRGVDVHTIPWRSDQARGLARIGLIADRARVLLAQQRHDRPFMVEKYDRPELRRAIDRILDSSRFDTVQVEYSFLAPAASWAINGSSAPSAATRRPMGISTSPYRATKSSSFITSAGNMAAVVVMAPASRVTFHRDHPEATWRAMPAL